MVGIFHCYVRLPECIAFVSQFLFRPPFFFTAFSLFQELGIPEPPIRSKPMFHHPTFRGKENLCSCKACIATRVSMEVSNWLASWFITYLRDL